MDYTTLLFLLLLSGVKTQEVTTPSNLLGPRDFNHHSYDADQSLNKLSEPSATKQGPVLFPNDAPPPPPTPLIVTSRPLIESIARSELNPNNNTVAAQSQINGAIVPAYLGRVKSYTPFGRSLGYEGPTSAYDEIDYNYASRSGLPPIYKKISDHAQQNFQTAQQAPKQYGHQVKQPIASHHRYNDGNDDESNSDYNQGENYAFSYIVKDKERGDDFSHSQQSSGSATNGEYRVRLPDGRMQIVSYTADENGYKADVRYDDEEKPVNNIDNGYQKTNYQNDNRYIYNHNTPKHNNYNTNNIGKNYNAYIPKTTPVTYVDNNKINDEYKVNDYNDNDNINNDNINNGYNNNGYSNNGYNNNVHNNIAKDKQFKVNEKDYYGDISKEYFNDDYSSEYNVKYEPHNTKYTSFLPKSENSFQTSTIKPNYDELKDLFSKEIFNTQQNYDTKNFVTNIPYTTHSPRELTAKNKDTNLYESPTYSSEGYGANSATPIYVPDFNEHNIAYTTQSPLEYNTERTVLIGAKRPVLFTDIKSSIPSLTGNSFVPTTPGTYLVSTISSLKNNFSPTVLSNKFIDKIHKYLSFK